MSADDDDTDPATPSAKSPTLAMVSRQIAALSHQVVLLREQHDSTAGDLAGLRASVPPQPRPSLMAKAAGKGKGLLALLGFATALGQVVAVFYPKLEGPLAALVKGLAVLTGASP